MLEDEYFYVTYNILTDWVIHSPSGTKIILKIILKSNTGLCPVFLCLDLHKLKSNKKAITLINTGRDNYEGYTKRDIAKAILAWKAQSMVRHPSDDQFRDMVSNKNNLGLP